VPQRGQAIVPSAVAGRSIVVATPAATRRWPQLRQKDSPGGFSWPQRGHCVLSPACVAAAGTGCATSASASAAGGSGAVAGYASTSLGNASAGAGSGSGASGAGGGRYGSSPRTGGSVGHMPGSSASPRAGGSLGQLSMSDDGTSMGLVGGSDRA